MNHDHECDMTPPKSNYSDSYIKLSSDRAIFLTENITKKSASELSALLLHYDNESHKDPVTIYINSSGGDVSGLLCIYDVMRMVKAPIKTICLGRAYSAGAVILAAGSQGYRGALKSSKVMIHGIQFGFPVLGDDIISSKNYFEFIESNNDSIMKLLSKHTQKSLSVVKEDCKQDYWMSADEALEYGIIDYIA